MMPRKTLSPALAAALLGVAFTGSTLAAGDAANGEKLYNQTCIACHGEDGTGSVPGTPDLTQADGPLSKPDSELVNNIMEGFQSPGSPMAMPPQGGNPELTEDDARDLVVYMRRRFSL